MIHPNLIKSCFFLTLNVQMKLNTPQGIQTRMTAKNIRSLYLYRSTEVLTGPANSKVFHFYL